MHAAGVAAARRGNSGAGALRAVYVCLASVCLALAGVWRAALAASRCALQGNTWQFKDFHSKDPVQV